MSEDSGTGCGTAAGIRVIEIPQPAGYGEQFALARESGTARRGARPAFAWYCGSAGFRCAPPGGASLLNIVRFRGYRRAVSRARELAEELAD
jgi:hypothetical protein